MTPAMTIVGEAMPYAIFRSNRPVEPRAGEETSLPV